jgi:hypothetical protein
VFRDLTRELHDLERGIQVSVPLPSDADGYVEKECPSPECLSRFKIHTDDWSSLCSDEAVYCALCRHEADSQQWFTPEELEVRDLPQARLREARKSPGRGSRPCPLSRHEKGAPSASAASSVCTATTSFGRPETTGGSCSRRSAIWPAHKTVTQG